MTTHAKIAANRRNAQLSTGPRTEAGKLAVAQNAIRHGIFTNLPVVPGERLDDWHAHRAGVVASLAPSGLLEVTLAERAALLLWRLARLARYEAEVITAAIEDAGLLPPDVDPIPHAMLRPYNHENQLKFAEQELRRARVDDAAVAPVAELLRRVGCGNGTDPLPRGSVRAILDEAFGLALESCRGRYKPAGPSEPAFLTRVRRDAPAAAEKPWTREQLLACLDYYAEVAGLTADDFRAGVQAALDTQAARARRAVERLEAEAAALVRRLEGERSRSALVARLSPEQVTDRVMKYERHLHSLLASTLHELERLQSRRAGVPVVPPLVADIQVQVTGTEADG